MSRGDSTTTDWFAIENAGEIPTPALIVYRQRVAENIRRMIAVAGDARRLRPHVKTHKMAEVVRMQLAAGIRAFKCATLAEAQMLARCRADHVLVACPLAGPHRRLFASLVSQYPDTRLGVLVDDLRSLELLEQALLAQRQTADAYLDLDVGMHRTGIAPGPLAIELFRRLAASPALRPAGLHAYDGHLKQHEADECRQASEAGFAAVDELAAALCREQSDRLEIVAGGSPTFAIHARHADRVLSPGTCVFWDWAYATKFPDLDFVHAALVLARVISRPVGDLLCLDLGYKAVSPDNPNPRVYFPQLPDAEMVLHSEEHLLIRGSQAGRFAIDDCLYGIPYHICPTVALYDEALVVEDHRVIDRWPVAARRRDVQLESIGSSPR